MIEAPGTDGKMLKHKHEPQCMLMVCELNINP